MLLNPCTPSLINLGGLMRLIVPEAWVSLWLHARVVSLINTGLPGWLISIEAWLSLGLHSA